MTAINFLCLSSLIFMLSCNGKQQEDEKMDKSENNLQPKIIAHRGGAKLAPENTLAAFKNAISIGVDMIEIDVHLSKDSNIIVIHDATLNRTTDGTGEIKNLSLAEIKNYDAGSWFSKDFDNEKVPTLSEVLETINGKVVLLIEIKDGDERYPGLEKKIVEAVKNHDAVKWVIIQSFNKNSIIRIKKIYPELVTFYLSGKTFDQFYSEILEKMKSNEKIEKQFDGIAASHSLLDANKVVILHKADFKVFTYTVNKPQEMKNNIDIGVDGIITDSPDKLKAILQ